MKYCVIGGAGFIGSHLVKTLLAEDSCNRIVVYDNFSSGKKWHLENVTRISNLQIVSDDIKNTKNLESVMTGMDVVYHFAANPDISKAVTLPDIDFWEGTYLTNNVIEAMRKTGVKRLLYASGSGVYGDAGFNEIHEDHTPMLPISTYGASKLACETLIAAYCHMFDMTASAFRFANVVGPHQTHGVGYDFVRRLIKDPHQLQILGDGTQSKSYIHISDVINAMLLLERIAPSGFTYYNVSTLDHINVTEIANVVTEIMGLKNVVYSYAGGNRGWKGDVPVVRLNSGKIRTLGWVSCYSTRDAIYSSVQSIYEDVNSGKV